MSLDAKFLHERINKLTTKIVEINKKLDQLESNIIMQAELNENHLKLTSSLDQSMSLMAKCITSMTTAIKELAKDKEDIK